jgi:hypothetical protein
VYLPPAAEGDVYRVAQKKPQVIGIVDGYFQSVPAVRHKEILWAMARGIHVFGSASMGALRASELAPFGMEGVGKIFEFYRDGVLEDDDEVAIAHGPSKTGFLNVSEAMINIRQTLREAEKLRVISKKISGSLERIGKQLFYADRSYPLICQLALERGLPQDQLDRLRRWLPHGKVDQKREDALCMLRLIRQRVLRGLKPKRVSYCFQHTVMWESAWRQGGKLRFSPNDEPEVIGLESLLDEFRLEGKAWQQQKRMALHRFFATREAERLGTRISWERRRKVEVAFRQERGLTDGLRLKRWMKDNDLSDYDFDTLMRDEALVRWIDDLAQFASRSYMPEQLRLSGSYPKLAARAEAKMRLLRSLRLTNPSLKSAGLSSNELLRWYFEKLLGRAVPKNHRSYAYDMGFANPDAFRRALLREYLYRRAKKHGSR